MYIHFWILIQEYIPQLLVFKLLLHPHGHPGEHSHSDLWGSDLKTLIGGIWMSVWLWCREEQGLRALSGFRRQTGAAFRVCHSGEFNQGRMHTRQMLHHWTIFSSLGNPKNVTSEIWMLSPFIDCVLPHSLLISYSFIFGRWSNNHTVELLINNKVQIQFCLFIVSAK